MMIVDQLVVQHQALRNKVAAEPDALDMNEVMALMEQVRAASAHIENPQQREQLATILYHWNGYVYDKTGTYPGVQLTVFTPLTAVNPTERTPQITATRADSPLPRIHWLVWALAILLFGGGILIVIWPLLFNGDPLNAVNVPPETEVVYTAVAATQTTLAATPSATPVPILQTAEALIRPPVLSATPANDTLLPTATPADPAAYTVQQGDTLFSLAMRYGLSANEIMVMNNLTSEALAIGQQLILPNLPLTPAPTAASQTITTPLTSPTATLRPGEQLVEAVVQKAAASLYSGPGEQYASLMALARGTFVYALGRSQDGAWYLVQLEDGITRGWVLATDVGLIYPATPEIIPVITTP
jgi:LysM repeat protein